MKRQGQSPRSGRTHRVSIEPLEPRQLLSASPVGITPAQIRTAYGFANATFTFGGVVYGATGRGQTIAIVDAYNDPTISADLTTFDNQFALPSTDINKQFSLTVATPFGTPATNASWTQETSLDVEWAHAVAPKAHILLVEARSDNFTDLINAVNYARQQTGVVAVSMSWGGYEFSGETGYDQTFTTPSGHIGGSGLPGGIVFLTAAGDNGAGASYPAASPNVLSVGGTTLNLDSNGNYVSETAWSGSGGGTSRFEGTNIPDVSYDADPNTGFAVFDSTAYNGQSGWQKFGGTSAGTPQWAGLIADMDQGLAYLGNGSPDGATSFGTTLYGLPETAFHDITTGSNGRFSAGPGYDLVTGLGTPNVVNFLEDTVGTNITSSIQLVTSKSISSAANGGNNTVSPSIFSNVKIGADASLLG